jgi:hypothetical protein
MRECWINVYRFPSGRVAYGVAYPFRRNKIKANAGGRMIYRTHVRMK